MLLLESSSWPPRELGSSGGPLVALEASRHHLKLRSIPPILAKQHQPDLAASAYIH